jgi:hypothetical protein
LASQKSCALQPQKPLSSRIPSNLVIACSASLFGFPFSPVPGQTALSCCNSRLNHYRPIRMPHVFKQHVSLGIIINSYIRFFTTSTLFSGSRVISRPSMTNCSLTSSHPALLYLSEMATPVSVRGRIRRMQGEATRKFSLQSLARVLESVGSLSLVPPGQGTRILLANEEGGRLHHQRET